MTDAVQLPQINVTVPTPTPLAGTQGLTPQDYSRIAHFPFPNRAVVIINGVPYWEWTSVQVEVEANGNPISKFRLTTSEQVPLLSTADKLGAVPASQNFAYLRIRPPDQCVIYLDGYLALQGEVAARQVFYNGTEHAIEIQGVGETNILARSGAVSQTGEFKNQTLAAAAQSLAAPLGIGVMPFGLPATVPFERLSVQPGETIWEFIERAGRSIGAMYVDTPGGTLVLGDVTTPVATTDEVIEGVNIIEAREIIQTLVNYGLAAASSQAPGNDNRSMASAAQLFASATGAGIVSPGTIGHIINEIPGFTQQFMQLRAMHDRNIEDGNSIKVWVSLNGFQKPSGGLWWPLLQNVFIDSPMLLMQQYLRLTKVTFSQDNRGGTRSQLELSNLASTKADAPS